MSKKRKTVAYGYVGEWNDGTLGWFLPQHLDSGHTLKKPTAPYGNISPLHWRERYPLQNHNRGSAEP